MAQQNKAEIDVIFRRENREVVVVVWKGVLVWKVVDVIRQREVQQVKCLWDQEKRRIYSKYVIIILRLFKNFHQYNHLMAFIIAGTRGIVIKDTKGKVAKTEIDQNSGLRLL